MKKVTVKSNVHNSEATFLVPESVYDANDAMEWLTEQYVKEFDKLGRYGPARDRYLKVWRKLCGIKNCKCFIRNERV